MNVTLIHPSGETEFDIPENRLELVRMLLMELATGAQNIPIEKACMAADLRLPAIWAWERLGVIPTVKKGW